MTTPIRASVFVGTSLDGFIARRNGDLDFLPPGGGEDHGYREFMETVDGIVIGRHTYEQVLTLEDWPYGAKPVIVLSTRPIERPRARDARVERMSGPPAEIRRQLAARGHEHLYIDGGITVQQFLRAGLIECITVTRVPVLIGEGIPLFGSLPRDVRLQHLGTRQYPTGLVTSAYQILR
jgi:dihydrofolate reductase